MATGDHDWTAGEQVTAANMDDFLQLQVTGQYATNAARDSALSARKRENMVTAQADTNALTVYSGAAWSTIGPVHGALTAWTPTVTQSGSVTVTVNYARYTRIGRLIIGWFQVSVTGSGTGTNPIIIGGIPATASSSAFAIGTGSMLDASAGLGYSFNIFLTSTTTFDLRSMAVDGVAEQRQGVAGFTAGLASSDTINGHFLYEASADA